MQYICATLARLLMVALCYAYIFSSGASVPQDTPRQTEGMGPGGLRHRDEEIEGRPWPLEIPPEGDGVVALKAQAY